MDCPICGERTIKTKQNYNYSECGLENVVLINIDVYECVCGEIMPAIPNILGLHKAIVLSMIDGRVDEEEFKFVLKELNINSKTKNNWEVDRYSGFGLSFDCTYHE